MAGDSADGPRPKAAANNIAASRPVLRLLKDRILHPRSSALMFAPLIRENPYQALIYSAFSPSPRPVSIQRARRIRPLLHAPVLHLHWDEFLFSASNASGAQRRMEAARAFVRAGGKIVWTMHNAVPHGLADPDLIGPFKQYRRQVIELASLVHVHSQAAERRLSSEFDIDHEKLVVIPHPSYGDWYGVPVAVPPADDRFDLLVFGSSRKSRGLELVRSAIPHVTISERPFHLRIAGSDAQAWQGLADGNPHIAGVTTTDGFIPDDRIAQVFAGASFSAFGFSEIMTSGSLMLSLTMGVPPIAPDLPSIREQLTGPLSSFLYRPGDARHLAEVIDSAARLDRSTMSELRAYCLQLADTVSPRRVSEKLAQAVSLLHQRP